MAESTSPGDQQHRDNIMPIDDAEWAAYKIRERKRLPRPNESLPGYLDRLRLWSHFPDATYTELQVARIAGQAYRAYHFVHDAHKGLHARMVLGGRCSCTDLLAHGRVHTACPSLSDFTRNSKKGCVRCWFVVHSIAAFGDRFAQHDPTRIQVRIKAQSKRFLEGDFSRIRVRWVADGSTPTLEPYLAQPPEQWRKLDLELWTDEDGYQMGRSRFYRQPSPVRSDTDVCFGRIAKWIDTCVQDHSCAITFQERSLPTRLIDTSPDGAPAGLRLVLSSILSPEDTRYAALSHCWGNNQTRNNPLPVTTTATLPLNLRQINWDSLTPTFQDSIIVVRRLGLRYVWIDSLCIVQDDPADFAREAGRMASVYGQAFFVIAATRGTSGDAGLFHDRAEAHLISQSGPSRIPGSYLYVSEAINHQPFATNNPFHFDTTPLFERAWCFQERLLASRVVHFSNDEIVFECGYHVDCECRAIVALGTVETFKMKTMAALRRDLSTASRLELWYSVVEPYSACRLTHESDRLPALSGFAHLLTSPGLGQYCAGLWQSELPSGLLWRVVRPAPGLTTIYRPSEKDDQYYGPSWSWISVRGTVEAHLRWHDAIQVLAEATDAECIPASSEDHFGAVESAKLDLSGPVFQVLLHQDPDKYQEQRACFMTPAEAAKLQHDSLDRDEFFSSNYGLDESGRMPFDLDVPMIRSGFQATCIAIEKWHPRIKYGQVSCLVLEESSAKRGIYSRIAVAHCPAAWLSLASSTTVTII